MKILHLVCFMAVILCGYDCIALAKVSAVGWLFAAILAIVGIAIVRDYIQEELNTKNQR